MYNTNFPKSIYNSYKTLFIFQMLTRCNNYITGILSDNKQKMIGTIAKISNID